MAVTKNTSLVKLGTSLIIYSTTIQTLNTVCNIPSTGSRIGKYHMGRLGGSMKLLLELLLEEGLDE